MAPQKNMALGKFWPDLEVWKAFLIGLEVSFSGDFASRGLEIFFKSRCRVCKPGSGILAQSRICHSDDP